MARDVRGNTLAMIAAFIFPLLGLLGGGIDMSRIYLTRSRMQQACDAGALAGRKIMGGGAWAAANGQAESTANSMFDANFQNGSYGSGPVTRSFTESAGKVSGVASAPLPMAIMRVFGFASKDISISCDAEMRLPNTDVMFVLDVTGSMGSPIPGDSESKIVGLRRAVRCFYEIVARLDTEAVCEGGAPSGGTSSETQIRFGFVPYATNVNVGKLLPSNWFVDTATYQSREITTTTYGVPISYVDANKTDWNDINWSKKTATTTSEALCKSTYTDPYEINPAKAGTVMGNGRKESNGGVQGQGNWEAIQKYQDVRREFTSWKAGNNNCVYRTKTREYDRTFTFKWSTALATGALPFKAWLYRQVAFDVRSLKSGNGWASPSSMTTTTANNYANRTFTWDGCIEERQTVRAINYTPVPDGALDLDIDTPPGFAEGSRWKPALAELIYQRKENYDNSSNRSMTPITTFENFSTVGESCPTPSTRLVEWPDATAFDSYVSTLTASSSTYHDIGLIWGARLMSPTGLFAADNATTPRGGEIQRHLIFMTDGKAETAVANYQAYGIAWYDRRQTDFNVEPTDGSSPTATLTQQVNARTQAVCAAIRNMPNTTLWVIWFGTADTANETLLRSCATPDRFFSARSSTALQTTFRNIANQISQLRLTS
ncbi:Tad domain-containing protein [Sphingobium aromaticiconvertens]|uniref:Tad domain-containing protein n=1 Tax=Sphingobium aromaticiconvertens TaxID=365341 RepID=UPI0030181A2D